MGEDWFSILSPKNTYSSHCSSGGYSGRLEITHAERVFDDNTETMKVSKKGAIEIRVRPPGKLSDVNLNSLSGGERSYVSGLGE